MIFADDILDAILIRESSAYTDRPADAGGPTCCGITLETYRQVMPSATVEDLRRLTPTTAKPVYQHLYIDAPGFSQIDDPQLRALVVDAGVQHGVTEAARMIQRAVGVLDDGRLGPVSLLAINEHPPLSLRMLVCGARIRLYGVLVSHDPSLIKARQAGFALQADNALGWANRIAQFVEAIA